MLAGGSTEPEMFFRQLRAPPRTRNSTSTRLLSARLFVPRAQPTKPQEARRRTFPDLRPGGCTSQLEDKSQGSPGGGSDSESFDFEVADQEARGSERNVPGLRMCRFSPFGRLARAEDGPALIYPRHTTRTGGEQAGRSADPGPTAARNKPRTRTVDDGRLRGRQGLFAIRGTTAGADVEGPARPRGRRPGSACLIASRNRNSSGLWDRRIGRRRRGSCRRRRDDYYERARTSKRGRRHLRRPGGHSG